MGCLFDNFVDPDTHISEEEEEERESLEMSQIIWETAQEPREEAPSAGAAPVPVGRPSERTRTSGDPAHAAALNTTLWGSEEDDDTDFLKQLDW